MVVVWLAPRVRQSARVRASPREPAPSPRIPRFSAPPAVRAGPRPVRVFRHSAYPAGALQSAPRGISGGLGGTANTPRTYCPTPVGKLGSVPELKEALRFQVRP